MSSPLKLSITPFKPSEIPPEADILTAGRELLSSTESWKEGKTYAHNTVKTFHQAKQPGDSAAWHCRVSVHGPEDATFDEFWSKLGNDKAENEKGYIHVIDKVTLVKQVSPTQSIWTLHYKLPAVSARVFTVLQTVHLDSTGPKKTGIVVSLPIDLKADPADAELAKLEEKGVKGRYVSVERIQEMEDGKVEWRMATSSTSGGSIPQFIVERSLPGEITKDVPAFLKWFHTIRDQNKAKKSSEAPQLPPVPTTEDTTEQTQVLAAPLADNAAMTTS